MGSCHKYLLSLGMDWLNVNKSIWEKLNDKKKQQSLPQLVKCPPSCLIHVCHSSFHRGLSQYGNNVEELCLALHYFFKHSSCKRQDLFEIEGLFCLEELLVMHHAQNCWLSLVPALQHIVQMQDAIKKLLEDLPKFDKRITANDKYLFIKRSLESEEMSIEMEFHVSIKSLFDDFMTRFQKEEPMGHMLHNNCQQPLKVAVGRLLRSACFSDKEGKELTNINVDDVSLQLGTEDFKTMQGPKVVMLLKELPVGAQRKAVLGMKSYKEVIKDLQTNYH